MNIKSEKGAATLYTLIATVVFTAIAVGLFITSSNKQRIQLEAIEETKKIYNTEETAELAYQQYVGGDVIPVYTAEQLAQIGTNNNVTIHGKIYTFSTGKTYVLKNNITYEDDFSTIQDLINSGDITIEGQDYKITEIYNSKTTVYSGKSNFQSAEGQLSQLITIEDYGKNVKYSVNVNGIKLDDWKVFYNDGNNVYIILGDYLPNQCIPNTVNITAGTGTYGVNLSSYANSQAVETMLTNNSYWTSFVREDLRTNSKATAMGSPTYEIFKNSWNSVKTKQLPATITSIQNDYADGTGLYIPHINEYNNCVGYWLASRDTNDSTREWYVWYNNGIHNNVYSNSANYNISIRPIVSISSTVTGTVGNNITID